MNDILGTIFFIVSLLVTLPITLVSFFWLKKMNKKNIFVTVLVAFTLLLTLAAIVNCLIGSLLSYDSSPRAAFIDYVHGGTYEVYHYQHICVWIGFGFAIGALFFSLVSIVTVWLIRSKNLNNKPAQTIVKNQPVQQKRVNTNYSYIDEIKELKKLLDSGVITQSEFDMKKKQILGDVLK